MYGAAVSRTSPILAWESRVGPFWQTRAVSTHRATNVGFRHELQCAAITRASGAHSNIGRYRNNDMLGRGNAAPLLSISESASAASTVQLLISSFW